MPVVEKVSFVEIPEGVEVMVNGRVVTVKGKRGELIRDYSHAPLFIRLDENIVKVQANWPRKKNVALVGTIRSHIRNMITGVTAGFTYKLKVAFSHFPISVKVKGKSVEKAMSPQE